MTTPLYEKNKKTVEMFTADIIKALKEGTAPWTKPWKAGELVLPRNPITGTIYRGVNTLNLFKPDFADPRWVTFRQAQERGLRVKKNSKSKRIVFWQWTKQETIKDEDGNPVLDENGKEQKETVQLQRPNIHSYAVFHASQLTKDGKDIPPYKPDKPQWNPDERAEIILKNADIEILHDQRDRAFYRPATDSIHLPLKENFPDSGAYYSTALHELAHATKNPDRLNRNEGKSAPFGSEEYAREELRAEIASLMLATELGLPHDPGEHMSYINSWIKILEQDPYEIIRAAKEAEKIKDYIMGLEQEQEQVHQEKYDVSDTKTELVDPPENVPEKIYLNVSYKEKDAVKKLGAKWDRNEKKWFVMGDTDLIKFEKWIVSQEQEAEKSKGNIAQEATRLNVPFREKEAAKALGARWDRKEKSWYVPAGTDLNRVAKWLPGQTPETERDSVINPVEEFGRFIKDNGLIIDGAPKLDGKIHRVAVEGGKKGTKDGAYCGYADGRPNGWCQNYKTGVQERWIATGHSVSMSGKTMLKQETQAVLDAREAERMEERIKAEKRAYAKWINAEPAQEAHPYIQKKGVLIGTDVRQDKNGNLIVPAYNLETGKIQTAQYINADGGKWYEKGCSKEGAVHLLPGKEAFNKKQEVVLIAEGYATGASLHQATGLPVAVAFDAGNLESAALTIHKRLPNAKITICADNDHQHSSGRNVGVDKAKEAAALVHGKVIAPEFTKEEKAKGLTDFNDLHKSRGLEAVKEGIARGGEKEAEVEVER